jgi:RNA polymerase sigma-70 factor (ECF subfamily)
MSTLEARRIWGIPRAFEQRPEPAGAAAGTDARLVTVVRRHYDLIWRSVRRFGVPASAADDAVQHVLLLLADRLWQIEVGRERAFLLSVSVRVAANFRRRIGRTREVALPAGDGEPTGGASPEDLLEQKEQRSKLDEGLGTLPLDQRAVFVLFELEGLTLPEIADSLGIPLGTATSRLRRARARFEHWLSERRAAGGAP